MERKLIVEAWDDKRMVQEPKSSKTRNYRGKMQREPLATFLATLLACMELIAFRSRNWTRRSTRMRNASTFCAES